MSRDLTPRELYTVQQESGRSTLFVMATMCVVVHGRKVPVYSQRELKKMKKYPLLGNLLNGFPKIYDTFAERGRLDILNSHERELKTYIETGNANGNSDTIRWYNGDLDSDFYYCEQNQAMLIESYLTEAGIEVPDN